MAKRRRVGSDDLERALASADKAFRADVWGMLKREATLRDALFHALTGLVRRESASECVYALGERGIEAIYRKHERDMYEDQDNMVSTLAWRLIMGRSRIKTAKAESAAADAELPVVMGESTHVSMMGVHVPSDLVDIIMQYVPHDAHAMVGQTVGQTVGQSARWSLAA